MTGTTLLTIAGVLFAATMLAAIALCTASKHGALMDEQLDRRRKRAAERARSSVSGEIHSFHAGADSAVSE